MAAKIITTIYRILSMSSIMGVSDVNISKLFTTTICLHLIAKGKFQLVCCSIYSTESDGESLIIPLCIWNR